MYGRSLRNLFFALDEPIDGPTYLKVGVSLMALKYIVDALVILWVAGIVWTPIDYLVPLVTLTGQKISRFPLPLNLFLLLWMLPFIWIGVTLSVRRTIDAGISPWTVVAFFIPLLNYVVMILLTRTPSKPRPADHGTSRHPSGDRGAAGPLRSTAFGAVAGAATGLAAAAIDLMLFRTYSGTLFLMTPFLIGMVSALVANSIEPRSRGELLTVGMIALGITGGLILLVALEGIVCVAMAIPVTLPLQLIGSVVGGLLSTRQTRPFIGLPMVLLLAPAGQFLDAITQRPELRTVTTSIEVNASPEAVWRHVVSFSDISAAPAWYFRTGLAYPLRARIEGSGVGAVRHCEFTTGAFIEPITAWDAPRRLAFNVAAQPPPLQEWSPYSAVYAPHLDGFFRTSRGEFRLVAIDGGRTRLEGTTWYSLDMRPVLYWNSIADAILHAVHRRVLEHVKAEAEGWSMQP